MSKDLVVSNTPSLFSCTEVFTEAQRMAKLLASSDLIPTAYRNNIANCVIALELASRTKSSPLAVMQNLYIVQGKPGWSAQFIIAAVNATGRYSPIRFEMTDKDGGTCVAWAKERGTETILKGPPASVEMAKKEGWWSKKDKHGKECSKWQTMPELMLRYRAATFFGRLYAPEILIGMQTMEEIHDITVAESPVETIIAKQAEEENKTLVDVVKPVAEEPAKKKTEEVKKPKTDSKKKAPPPAKEEDDFKLEFNPIELNRTEPVKPVEKLVYCTLIAKRRPPTECKDCKEMGECQAWDD